MGTPTPLEEIPLSYRPTFEAQAIIGWSNAFRGRLSLQWNTLHRSQRLTGRPLDLSTPWTTQIATRLLSFHHTTWIARNGVRHGTDPESSRAAKRSDLHHVITKLYEARDQVHPDDLDIFQSPLEELLERPTSHLRRWVSTWRPVIDASCLRARYSAQLQQHPITNYFQPQVDT